MTCEVVPQENWRFWVSVSHWVNERERYHKLQLYVIYFVIMCLGEKG